MQSLGTRARMHRAIEHKAQLQIRQDVSGCGQDVSGCVRMWSDGLDVTCFIHIGRTGH